MNETLASLREGKLAGAKRLDLSCGLTEFPREIFALADSLEVLNLTGNQLSSLPDDLGRLKKLRILFCSENRFSELPGMLGDCPNLSMIGFKANQIEHVPDVAFPEVLRWFILTDNRISHLPATLGRCTRLQKLMLSGNRLEALPEEMAACVNLEMIRIASNQFLKLPEWLLRLPRLSWLALAGNPCCAETKAFSVATKIPWSALQIEQKLGEGASGVIHRASWSTGQWGAQPVAVKLFKSAVTSDGLASSEIAASLSAGGHPHLIGALAEIEGHPEGKQGLVMRLIDPAFRDLAGPPSLESCTRDVYQTSQTFTPAVVVQIALGVASAAAHLHAQGLMHGDLYAHNTQWMPDGRCLLGDLGAASAYHLSDHEYAAMMQGIEVRAWGCLLEELIERGEWDAGSKEIREALEALKVRCFDETAACRPSFEEIVMQLSEWARRG